MRLTFLAVLLLAATWLMPSSPAQPEPPKKPPMVELTVEEQTIKNARIEPTGAELVDLFRKRTKKTADPKTIQELIVQFQDKDAAKQSKAFGGLVALGMPAVPKLREVANNQDDLAAAERAKECLKFIEDDDNASLLGAAAKQLARLRPEGTVEALLNYLAAAESQRLFQDVEGAIVEAVAAEGKMPEALLQSLKDESAARRASAASIICQVGNATQREAVKALLKDPRPLVRMRAALGLVKRNDRAAVPVLIDLLAELPDEPRTLVEEYLTELAGEWKFEAPEGKTPILAKLRRELWLGWWKGSEGKALLEEFKKRTLSNEERDKVLALLKEFDKAVDKEREKAVAALVQFGPKAVPMLRRAATDTNPKISEGARQGLQLLEKEALPPLPPVAARLLALQRTEGAAETLLAYVPFIDNEQVAEVVLAALPDLVDKDGKVDPVFLEALKDPVAQRRAVAAESIAAYGGQHETLKKLLTDAEPEVRIRTALALAKAGEKEAMPSLIALVTEVPEGLTLSAQDYLSRLSGVKKPDVALAADEESRKKYREAWLGWWKDQGDKVLLVERREVQRVLGYTLVVEQYSPVGNGLGTVRELDGAGKQRWEIPNLNGPMHAVVVGSDRVLIAEQNVNRISERDFKGDIKWEKPSQQPIYCERLKNGNTFIVRRNGVTELDREGREVMNVNRPEYIMGGARLKDGSYVTVNNNYMYVRFDKTGRELKSFRLPQDPNGLFPWVLPNGNVLLGQYGAAKVIELDRDGKQVAEVKANQPSLATRTPSGGWLISSMNTRRVIELDRAGRQVREFALQNTQPWVSIRR